MSDGPHAPSMCLWQLKGYIMEPPLMLRQTGILSSKHIYNNLKAMRYGSPQASGIIYYPFSHDLTKNKLGSLCAQHPCWYPRGGRTIRARALARFAQGDKDVYMWSDKVSAAMNGIFNQKHPKNGTICTWLKYRMVLLWRVKILHACLLH